jgi:hypothetical protein
MFFYVYLLSFDIFIAKLHNQHRRRTVRWGRIVGAFIIFSLIARGFVNIMTLNVNLIWSSIRKKIDHKVCEKSYITDVYLVNTDVRKYFNGELFTCVNITWNSVRLVVIVLLISMSKYAWGISCNLFCFSPLLELNRRKVCGLNMMLYWAVCESLNWFIWCKLECDDTNISY